MHPKTPHPSSAPGAGSQASDRPLPDDTLPLPHEREGGAGYADHAPKGVVKQAQRDLADGQVDTDLHNQGGLDQAHRDALLQGEAAAQSPGGNSSASAGQTPSEARTAQPAAGPSGRDE